MKAEELADVLERLLALNKHRLEMEKAEAHAGKQQGAPTLVDVGDLDGRLKLLETDRLPRHLRRIDGIVKRLAATEERLGKLARAIDTVAIGYADHLKVSHGIDVNLVMLAEPGYEATCDTPVGRLDDFEKRLDEKLRKLADEWVENEATA